MLKAHNSHLRIFQMSHSFAVYPVGGWSSGFGARFWHRQVFKHSKLVVHGSIGSVEYGAQNLPNIYNAKSVRWM